MEKEAKLLNGSAASSLFGLPGYERKFVHSATLYNGPLTSIKHQIYDDSTSHHVTLLRSLEVKSVVRLGFACELSWQQAPPIFRPLSALEMILPVFLSSLSRCMVNGVHRRKHDSENEAIALSPANNARR
jgi:hypothetical protein